MYTKINDTICYTRNSSLFVIEDRIVTAQWLPQFYIRLSDYSILLKARHDELIDKSISLHNYEFNLRLTSILRWQLKNERKFFSPSPGFEPRSPGTENQWATLTHFFLIFRLYPNAGTWPFSNTCWLRSKEFPDTKCCSRNTSLNFQKILKTGLMLNVSIRLDPIVWAIG